MAFNNGFPITYQPSYYGPTPYYQQMQNPVMHQNQQMQQAQQTQQATIQNSGFVVVPSEADVRSYPVAPGNAITFKIENAPICYVKTMGFSQLESPTIERYRLVKEDEPVTDFNTPTSSDDAEKIKDMPYALKSDLTAIWDELNVLKEKVKTRTEKKTAKNKLVVVEEDDDDE